MTSAENSTSAAAAASKPSGDSIQPHASPEMSDKPIAMTGSKDSGEPWFNPLTGHCHCGAVSYTIETPPIYQGLCYCRDCQRLSGSAFLPWLVVTSSALKVRTKPDDSSSIINEICGTSIKGSEKVVSECGQCGSIVFGGRLGRDEQHTVYAGTLDDECQGRYVPSIAIFVKCRPAWAKIEGLVEFEEMPGGAN